MSADEDSDVPQLSAATFAALQEFYQEQEERELKEKQIHDIHEGVFDEDWQLSQFWYDDSTIERLVQITLDTVGLNAKIALVSCPTIFQEMKRKAGPSAKVTLFEYDKRFAAFGPDFIFYDYKSPLSIHRDKSSYYDIVLADPPFLSEECLTKTAATIKYLSKEKVILCTGAIMAELANKLLDLQEISFKPKHRNNLANEFRCFTNFHVQERGK
ncbi:EEF1A lysine methyltransferase 1 [Euwallacea similis]|uniref:EEF1A lysine methyltransferase 1 n=1 Tax=Euwallacea similis TaxID=1736056 RepID=UPI00344B078D